MRKRTEVQALLRPLGRNLDDHLKSLLRIRAARHDHSMEEEARSILRSALSDSEDIGDSTGIGTRIRKRLEGIGGVELGLSQRTEKPRVPEIPE
ncbi:MAG: plasmid stabilization protein [Spirochaetaceae bacterium]|nr:MAG: plasmid stabilization protein [Spirochaetaceae bacterium]